MKNEKHLTILLQSFLVLLSLILPLTGQAAPLTGPTIAGCPLFPPDNIWNTPIDSAPIHPNSALWMDVNNGHTGHPLHPDFGTVYNGAPNGLPINIVSGTSPKTSVTFTYAGESDPGPYPLTTSLALEGGSWDPTINSGDRHMLMVDKDSCRLYELFSLNPPDASGNWSAGSGAIWDLNSNTLRPDVWTSADAAGLPIVPGLVTYDEVATGEIKHALRFTVVLTWKPHHWPARHDAASGSANNPPMGMRVRLKANFDISGYSVTNQVILRALKKYGMILADNGGDWFISGAPDARWDDGDLHLLTQITPSTAFEVVDISSWMVDPNSGQARAVTSTAGSTCDLNGDGYTNVADVQGEVNQALGISACKNDINLDGSCNVVDVQRVVNAALGGTCITQ